jgi:hypothetical protein
MNLRELIWGFKGMIRPGMAMGFDDSRKVAARKSIPMVDYLRARRGVSDPTNPQWMRDDQFRWKTSARQAHLRIAAAMEARDVTPAIEGGKE